MDYPLRSGQARIHFILLAAAKTQGLPGFLTATSPARAGARWRTWSYRRRVKTCIFRALKAVARVRSPIEATK